MERRSILMAVLLALALFGGCGPERPKTIPVTGTITFKGGPPPAAGSVFFSCLKPAEGYVARPAFGAFDAAGNVTVSAFDDTPGLVPGKYEVRLECWKTPPTEMSPGESHLPADFQPVEFDVPTDAGSVELKIDVK